MWKYLLLLLSLIPNAAAAREGWIPIGPTGGSVRALAVDPNDPGRIYLGTPDGVLYRSDDAGVHWRRLEPGFPRRGCSLDELVVDDRGTLYIGFWEVAGHGGGVARSANGGRSVEILKGMDGESVRALAIAPSDPRRIAAGTLSGVFLSDDAGKRWKRISTPGDSSLHNVASLAFDPDDAQVIYAGTWHLAWKTTDGGGSWGPAHRGMVDDSHVMTLNAGPQDQLFATACTGIYASSDGGSQWTKLEGIPEESRRTRSFRESPDGNLLLAGTTGGLWISENRGRTWRLATRKDLVVNAVLLEPDGTILLGTDDEGVLRSTDRGGKWTASNDGFTERLVTRLLFDGAHGRVLAAARGARPNGDLYVAGDVRGPWADFGQGLRGRQVLSLAVEDSTLFAGTDDGVFARTPGADQWIRLHRGPGRDLHRRVSELLELQKHRLLAATSSGLLLSPDAGSTWTATGPAMGDVYALAVSPADPAVILAASRQGYFRSEDAGSTWTQASWPLQGVIPHAIAFVPAADGNEVLATTSMGLMRSQDGGATCKWVTAGIPRCDLMGLAVAPDGRTLLASDFTRGGLFRSADGGRTWGQVTTRGLVSDRVWMLEVDPADPAQVLAGSAAGGLSLLVTSSPVSADAVMMP